MKINKSLVCLLTGVSSLGILALYIEFIDKTFLMGISPIEIFLIGMITISLFYFGFFLVIENYRNHSPEPQNESKLDDETISKTIPSKVLEEEPNVVADTSEQDSPSPKLFNFPFGSPLLPERDFRRSTKQELKKKKVL